MKGRLLDRESSSVSPVAYSSTQITKGIKAQVCVFLFETLHAACAVELAGTKTYDETQTKAAIKYTAHSLIICIRVIA